MNLQANNHDIPLHCIVCPKQPDFSDISHLLTHIGSKGHLSHLFKLQTTAPTNPKSEKMFRDYNRWYEEHNLGDMIAERLRSKDKKGRQAAGGSRRANGRANAGEYQNFETSPPDANGPRHGSCGQQSRTAAFSPAWSSQVAAGRSDAAIWSASSRGEHPICNSQQPVRVRQRHAASPCPSDPDL